MVQIGFHASHEQFAPSELLALVAVAEQAGWCPPLPVLRRMGYRTAREIEHERIALKDAARRLRAH